MLFRIDSPPSQMRAFLANRLNRQTALARSQRSSKSAHHSLRLGRDVLLSVGYTAGSMRPALLALKELVIGTNRAPRKQGTGQRGPVFLSQMRTFTRSCCRRHDALLRLSLEVVDARKISERIDQFKGSFGNRSAGEREYPGLSNVRNILEDVKASTKMRRFKEAQEKLGDCFKAFIEVFGAIREIKEDRSFLDRL